VSSNERCQNENGVYTVILMARVKLRARVVADNRSNNMFSLTTVVTPMVFRSTSSTLFSANDTYLRKLTKAIPIININPNVTLRRGEEGFLRHSIAVLSDYARLRGPSP